MKKCRPFRHSKEAREEVEITQGFWGGILGSERNSLVIPGFRGGFSFEAAENNIPYFVPNFLGSVDAVLDAVMGNSCKVGLIQIEHSSLGRSIQSYRALEHYGREGLHIVGEFEHQMREQLVAPFGRVKAPFSPGLTAAEWDEVLKTPPDQNSTEKYLRGVQVIYGHESSLAQCQATLKREIHQWQSRVFPEPEQVGRAIASSHQSCLEAASVFFGREQSTNDTSDAELGTTNKVIAGLIPPLLAVEGVKQKTMAILHSSPWGDGPPAVATFLLVCRKGLGERDIAGQQKLAIKTSIVIEIANKPGKIAEALLPLSKHQITKLETYFHEGYSDRPLLHADFIGSQFDWRTKSALDKVRRKVEKLTVLGSYPIRKIGEDNK